MAATLIYEITKMFTFSASHQLSGLHPGHPCSRCHGHNYRVTASIASPRLDETGMVLDYANLKTFGAWIDDHLDHQHLNDVLDGLNPTAEHLAEYLAGVLIDTVAVPSDATVAVTVSETDKTTATCRIDQGQP